MPDTAPLFAARTDKQAIEHSDLFAPKFDEQGLICAVATDHRTGDVLMVAWMNAESLAKTLECGEAVYYSRSRKKLWHKGEESGNVQKVIEIRTDCDQDCLWLRVEQVGNAACHNGYRSCFYRSVPTGITTGPVRMTQVITEKAFDPEKVYGKK